MVDAIQLIVDQDIFNLVRLTVTNSSGSSTDDVSTRIRIQGDANGDDCVDLTDSRIWRMNYDPLGLNQNTYEMGDFNRDGKVDLLDQRIWRMNYNPLGLPSN